MTPKREFPSLKVAPLAGAWIETGNSVGDQSLCAVAPLAGAWIETLRNSHDPENGLVAPLAGAWIETRTCPTSEAPA